MGLRRNLGTLRRRTWTIIAFGVVVGALVGAMVGGYSALRVSTYSAHARVMLRLNDPAQLLNPLAAGATGSNAARDATAQLDIVTSTAVAKQAAARVSGATIVAMRRAVSVRRVGTDALIEITGTSPSRLRAARIANAFARAYVDVRLAATVASLQQVKQSVDAQLASLDARIADLDSQARAKPSSEAPPAQLAAAANRYQLLQGRQQELETTIGLRRGPAVLVSPASAADATPNSSPVRSSVLGALVGLAAGIVVAAIRMSLDERIRTSEEIGRATGLPVLAELPRDQRLKKEPTRLAVLSSPRSALSEASRALRASIELRETEHRRPVLLVTSAATGEGKSLVSANLAAAYALAGYRTVLVEGDMRSPRLSTVFGTYRAPFVASGEAVNGLSSLVRELMVPGADRPALEQAALLRTAVENLLFLPAGPATGSPSELLDSPAMAVLLADLANVADIVIIDAPPLLPVSDAAALARWSDAVLLVAAMGESRRSTLRRARQILAAHPRVLGVVANKMPASPRYAPHRRGGLPAATVGSPSLAVMRPLPVPTPQIGCPDANGNIWIDLSEELDSDDPRVGPDALQVSGWSR